MAYEVKEMDRLRVVHELSGVEIDPHRVLRSDITEEGYFKIMGRDPKGNPKTEWTEWPEGVWDRIRKYFREEEDD